MKIDSLLTDTFSTTCRITLITALVLIFGVALQINVAVAEKIGVYDKRRCDFNTIANRVAPPTCISGAHSIVKDGILYLGGEINDALLDEFLREDVERELRGEKTIYHIELNSVGGEAKYIYEIAEMIRDKGMTTNVREKAVCSSACTLIYQAGINRTAHRTARFMYHGVRYSPYAMKKNYFDCLKAVDHHKKGRQVPKGIELHQNTRDLGKCSAWLAHNMRELERSTHEFFDALIRYGADRELKRYYFFDHPKEKDFIRQGKLFGVADWVMYAEEAKRYGAVQTIYE